MKRGYWLSSAARAANNIHAQTAEVIMRFGNRCMVTLALTACALALSAYASRKRTLREKAREHQHALEVWENEGGIVRASTARPAEAL